MSFSKTALLNDVQAAHLKKALRDHDDFDRKVSQKAMSAQDAEEMRHNVDRIKTLRQQKQAPGHAHTWADSAGAKPPKPKSSFGRGASGGYSAPRPPSAAQLKRQRYARGAIGGILAASAVATGAKLYQNHQHAKHAPKKVKTSSVTLTAFIDELQKLAHAKEAGFLGDMANKIKSVAMTDVGGPAGVLKPMGQVASNGRPGSGPSANFLKWQAAQHAKPTMGKMAAFPTGVAAVGVRSPAMPGLAGSGTPSMPMKPKPPSGPLNPGGGMMPPPALAVNMNAMRGSQARAFGASAGMY